MEIGLFDGEIPLGNHGPDRKLPWAQCRKRFYPLVPGRVFKRESRKVDSQRRELDLHLQRTLVPAHVGQAFYVVSPQNDLKVADAVTSRDPVEQPPRQKKGPLKGHSFSRESPEIGRIHPLEREVQLDSLESPEVPHGAADHHLGRVLCSCRQAQSPEGRLALGDRNRAGQSKGRH